MTDQLFVFTCRDVRKHAFDFRRGELHTAEQRKMEDHLGRCENCRAYLTRIEGMLDAGATEDFTPVVDRDALFERIVAEVQPGERRAAPDPDAVFARVVAEVDPAPPVAPNILAFDRPAPAAAESDDEAPTPKRPGVALYVSLALAAGILIGLGAGLFFPREPAVPPTEMAQQDEPDPSQGPPAPAAPSHPIQFAELAVQPPPGDVEDVRIYGAATADWTIRTQGARRKLDLDEGALLVEFVPRRDHTLEVVADRFSVMVTGTIFYVSADDGLVGVVTGSVEVHTSAGERIALSDGEEWVAGTGVRPAPPAVREGVALHVDVTRHAEQLAVARAQAAPVPSERGRDKQVDAPRPPMSEEVVRTPRQELRAAADRALRAERYDVAAQYYERMVEEFSAADPANASLRLDLARIYVRHLRRERRALVHLQRFVEDRPQDPLTPAARIELCRIAEKVGEVLLECDR